MPEVHCPDCSTSVTSAWTRDDKEIICPKCDTRQPEPLQEIERWILPFRAMGFQLTRGWIAAIALSFVLLVLGVGYVWINRTSVASNVPSEPSSVPHDETIDLTQSSTAPDGEAVGPTKQPNGTSGEPATATQPPESSGSKPATSTQPPEPSGDESADSTQPSEPPDGYSVDSGQPSRTPEDREPDDPAQTSEPPSGEPGHGESYPGELLPSLQMPPCFFVRQSPVCGIVASPVQSLLAFAHKDGTVRFWDIREGSETDQTFKSESGSPVGMCFHPGGRLLVLLFRDGWELYDIGSGKLQVKTPSTSRLSAAAFSGDGRYLALGESKGGMTIRRLPDLSIVDEWSGLDGILCVGWCDSRNQFVTGSSDSVTRFWLPGESSSLGTRDLSTRLVGHLDWVSCLAQVSSTDTLLTGSWDRSVRAWDIRSGDVLTEFRGHDQRVSAVAASPDGQIVVSGTETGVVKTWHAMTGMEICTFRGHQDRITGIAFVGDHWIVTASADGSAKAWDATTGREGLPAPKRPTTESPHATDPRVAQAAQFATLKEEANNLVEQERFDTAAEKFREAIGLRPDYAELHACLGECLFELGEVREAIESFRTATQLQSGSGWYKYRLGMALLSVDRDREAVAELGKARNLLPDLAQLRLSLGQALLRQEQYTDAVAEFEEATKLLPKSAEAYHGLGVANAQLHRWTAAESALKKSLDCDRKYEAAYSDLIEVILASGQPLEQAAHRAEMARVLGVTIRSDTMEKLQQALSASR